jgi:hypothetical protein
MKSLLLLLTIFLLCSCQHNLAPLTSDFYAPVNNPPLVKNSIYLGGFSGLTYIKNTDPEGLSFYSLTDRGPNGDGFKYATTVNGHLKKYFARSFLLPDFQPRIVKLKIKNNETIVSQEILLKNPDGSKMSGLPNRDNGEDEFPMDFNNKKISFDLNGIDSESLAIDKNGYFWIGEEYSPSLLKFNKDGILIKRFAPQNSYQPKDAKILNEKYGINFFIMNLPEAYNRRAINRGFEAMTIFNNKIYAMTQSSLITTSDDSSKSLFIRILEFDLDTEKVIGEYAYIMDSATRKLGDLCVSQDGSFYLIEQDGNLGNKSFRSIYKFRLDGATNFLNMDIEKKLELVNNEVVLKTITPVKKELTLDLVKRGFHFVEKLEGLTLIDDHTFATINDNDFGIENGEINNQIKSIIGIFHF